MYLLPFLDIPPITLATIIDEVPFALFSLSNLSFFWKFSQSRNKSLHALFGVVCVVMWVELRTAQTWRLVNQSIGCIVESRLANQRLGCTVVGGEGSDMTAAAGLTFRLQWTLGNR